MSAMLPAPFIAIVDDHAGLREAIAALLESAGYRAKLFPSAEDFLRTPRATRAGCLVLDDRLSGMRGVDLQDRLHEAAVDIPIVFISAHEDDGSNSRERAMDHGALAFLRKPFDQAEFMDVVQKALRAPVVHSPIHQGAIAR
jgi:FixJ family two-component response regulator